MIWILWALVGRNIDTPGIEARIINRSGCNLPFGLHHGPILLPGLLPRPTTLLTNNQQPPPMSRRSARLPYIPRSPYASGIIRRHNIPFTDHTDRPAFSLWSAASFDSRISDDDPVPPTFSFQVYPAPGVSLTERHPGELFLDESEKWRIDVYEQLPNFWACVEHQLRERQWRKEHSGGPGRIAERYCQDPAMAGFLVFVDRAEWYWRDPRDDGKVEGPLAVWFDTREQHERRIISDSIDVEGMVYEQIEMRVERMSTPSYPNYGLNRVFIEAMRCPSEEPEEPQAGPGAPVGTGTEPQPPSPIVDLTDACITTDDGSIILQTGDDPELIYIIYPTFSTPADRNSIARRFAAHLGSRSMRLEVTPQLSGIRECIAHAATAEKPAGYRSGYGRRFPEYGYAAGTKAMQQIPSNYKNFLIVLDHDEWEREEGVCFVWVGKKEEIIVGRVGPSMRGMAGRLKGEI